MNKTELISKVAEVTGTSKKDADKYVNTVIDTIIKAVASGEKVSLVGFGTFEKHTRPAREGHNPRTKEPLHIDETSYPSFKAGKSFKDTVKANG